MCVFLALIHLSGGQLQWILTTAIEKLLESAVMVTNYLIAANENETRSTI